MIVSGPPRVCRNPPGPAQGGPQAPAPVLLNAIPSAKKPKKRTPGNRPERSKQVKTQAQGENACVEVASTPDVAGVRDSKHRGHGPILAFDRELWNRFIGKLKSGSFDRP
ncbi:DUF397 domain-containing protein [Saccharopolyspora pogona]|uniref:DUF397 domain-containing protein n=1 Tax=Saccharopolyspora pogona TaxID=333966 RepID=UPI001CC256FA|nr:DUF397 domain-containing protein [Saccharopolyspora pogona]